MGQILHEYIFTFPSLTKKKNFREIFRIFAKKVVNVYLIFTTLEGYCFFFLANPCFHFFTPKIKKFLRKHTLKRKNVCHPFTHEFFTKTSEILELYDGTELFGKNTISIGKR